MKRAFWSARTLRVDIWDNDGEHISTEDILGVDHTRSVFAYQEYGDLIVRLLNEHFDKEASVSDVDYSNTAN